MLFIHMSDAQKKECIEKYRHINVEAGTQWSQAHFDTLKEDLTEKGFQCVEIRWSESFSSQGDGASFIFEGLDNSVYFKGVFDNPEISESTKEFLRNVKYSCRATDSRYFHENTVRIVVDCSGISDDYEISYPTAKAFETMLHEFVVSTSQALYRDLENEYDHLISDLAVSETLIANEYNFNLYDMSIRDSADQGLTTKEQAALLISTAKVMLAFDITAAAACSNEYDGYRRGHLMAEGIERERADNLLEVELSQMVE